MRMSDDTTIYCKDCTENQAGGEHTHPTMTPEEFERKTVQLLLEEADNPVQWYYLSFALPVEDGGFLGGLYIEAKGTMSAVTHASLRGLNPGGEVMVWGPIDEDDLEEHVPEGDRYRLLTKEEVNGEQA